MSRTRVRSLPLPMTRSMRRCPHHEHGNGGWRERTIAWAEDLVALFVRHAWALRVSYARPVLGPNEQRVLESLVGVLRTTEQEPDRMRRVVGLLFYAVRGTALTIAEAREAEAASGIPEEDWWRTTSAALDESVPDFADRFPNTIWLLSQQSHLPTADDGSMWNSSRWSISEPGSAFFWTVLRQPNQPGRVGEPCWLFTRLGWVATCSNSYEGRQRTEVRCPADAEHLS